MVGSRARVDLRRLGGWQLQLPRWTRVEVWKKGEVRFWMYFEDRQHLLIGWGVGEERSQR